MSTTKTTIELNGKLYDTRTGKIVTPKTAVKSSGQAIDGFSKRSVQRVKPSEKPAVSRTKAQHATPKLQKSSTLMRPAVKKPKPVASVKSTPVSKHASFKKQDKNRLARAVAVPRSSAVNKFTHQSSHTVVKKQAPIEVIPPRNEVNLMNKVAHIATSTEAHVKHSVDMIEESLRNASSHLEVFDDKKLRDSFLNRVGFKNKVANLATLSFAGLLLFGFFAYQNAANIQMQVAAAKSGVSASMPSYKPAGFSAGRNISSEPGKVSITFTSNTNDKKFTVSQQASNWSSESLLTNHVLASKSPYQTFQNEGKTVYIYENSNATWMNKGIWYKIDGDANLTSDQLLRLANSL